MKPLLLLGMNPSSLSLCCWWASFEKIQRGDEFPAFFRGKAPFPWEVGSRISKSLECVAGKRSFCLPAELLHCFPTEQQMDVREERKEQKKWDKSRWRNGWNDSLGIEECQFICAWNPQFPAWKPNCSPIMEIWDGSRQGFNFFRIWAPAREICWSRAGIIRVLEVKQGICWKSSWLGWDLEGWDPSWAFRWKSRRV